MTVNLEKLFDNQDEIHDYFLDEKGINDIETFIIDELHRQST